MPEPINTNSEAEYCKEVTVRCYRLKNHLSDSPRSLFERLTEPLSYFQGFCDAKGWISEERIKVESTLEFELDKAYEKMILKSYKEIKASKDLS